MEAEAIIKQITREVLNRLNDQLSGNLIAINDKTKGSRILVIIPGFICSIKKYLNAVITENSDAVITLAVNSSKIAETLSPDYKVLDITDDFTRDKLADSLQSFGSIYCLSPGIKLIKSIKEGDDSRFVEWLVIYGLLYNLQVNFLIDFDLKSSNTLFKMVKDQLKTISTMGIRVKNINFSDAQHIKTNNNKTASKKLIKEKDIEILWQEGIRRLSLKESILTPLALDKARKVGMKVTY